MQFSSGCSLIAVFEYVYEKMVMDVCYIVILMGESIKMTFNMLIMIYGDGVDESL